MSMKKIAPILILVVVAAFAAMYAVFALFGSVGAASPTTEDGRIILRFGSWAGVDEGQEIQEILDEINSTAEEYFIIHQPQPADYTLKLQTSMSGRVAADLFWVSQEGVPSYAANEVLLDVTDCLAANDNPAANLDDYFPEILKIAQWEERTYGLPWVAQPMILYFNKALFDEAGVDYPDESWTWATFAEAAEALTMDLDGDGKNDQWGFTLNGWPPPQMFAWQAGGEVITPELDASPIDTPEAIKAWDYYGGMIYDDVHAVPEATIAERGSGEMFKTGNVAMFMGGASDDFDRVEGLDVGHSVVPKGPVSRANFAWTAATVVPSFTQYPEYACDALAKLSDAFHHWKIVAPRESLANVETIAESDPRKAEAAPVIVAAVEDMRAFNVIPRHQEWDNVFWKEFTDPLFHKRKTGEEAATDTRPKLETFLPNQ